jgi:choline dehydrogenase-like flavoprotein
MANETYPYSTFLRSPSEVIAALETSDVELERRDAQNVVLIRSDRFAATRAGMAAAAHVLRTLARRDPDLAAELLEEEFAWMHWLPEAQRHHCVADLLANLDAGADTGSLVPFALAVAAWRSTAEVWSDPNLARRLHGPLDGDGPAIERPHDRSA